MVWDGDVKPEEWHAQYDRMFSDPAFPPGGLMLADLRTAGGAPSIDDDVIEDMGLRWNRQAERLADMRLAIVPNGAWNKARRFIEREVSVRGMRSMVFAEPADACAWLGLDLVVVEPVLAALRDNLRANRA